MNVCILGRHGLIGSALAKRVEYYPDVGITSFPTPKTDVLFHFASYTHIAFEENPDYHMREIIDSFLTLLPYCRDHGIKFVYASSALVYEKEKESLAFTKCKKALELIASAYPGTLGLRIYPVYGPGETRTAIYQWCQAMKKGESPVIYGDGEQQRDFVYIDDVVDIALDLVAKDFVGVVDIGGGKLRSFNDIVKEINNILGTDIPITYRPAPVDYSRAVNLSHGPLQAKTSLHDGLKKVLGR